MCFIASAWDIVAILYSKVIACLNFQDIVNHVIDDLDEFMERIRVITAAWNDLEKLKGQKSKRKKQAGNNFTTLLRCIWKKI